MQVSNSFPEINGIRRAKPEAEHTSAACAAVGSNPEGMQQRLPTLHPF